MKKLLFLLGFILSTLPGVLAQISHNASYDPSAVKVTETLNESGDSVIIVSYPSLMQFEEDGLVPKSLTKAKSESEPQLVVEGRTWWYEAYRTELIREVGYQIGSPVEIDGTQWYPVNQIRMASKEIQYGMVDGKEVITNLEEPLKIDETVKQICYVRQEGSKIHSWFSSEICPIDAPLSFMMVGPFIQLFMLDEYELVFDLYGEEGSDFEYTYEKPINEDTEYSVPDELVTEKVTYRFGNVEMLNNSGHSYDCYSFECQNDLSSYYVGDSAKSIPQFGWISNEDKKTSELFFAPHAWPQICYFSCTVYDDLPQLRYVTDGENNILFERNGGIKLWELTEQGVADAVVEGESSDARWFTLDGRAIAEPTAAGIYIRQTEKGTKKVVIR